MSNFNNIIYTVDIVTRTPLFVICTFFLYTTLFILKKPLSHLITLYQNSGHVTKSRDASRRVLHSRFFFVIKN